MVDHIFDSQGHAAFIRGTDVISSRIENQLLYKLHLDDRSLCKPASGEIVGYLVPGQSPLFVEGAKDGLFP